MKIKLISTVLILCIVLNMFVFVPVMAETTGITWEVNGTVLTIGGSGPIPDYSYPSDVPWISKQKEITHVVIEDGVTAIGTHAFYYFTKLQDVSMGKGVKSISSSAFNECENVKNLVIGPGVETIAKAAFYSCSFESITIGKSVRYIGDLEDGSIDCAYNVVTDNPYFSSDGGVLFNKDKSEILRYPYRQGTSYTIPSTVIRIGNYAFYMAYNLQSLSIPEGVVYIGNHAFESCSKLSDFTLPSTLTDVGESVFEGCTSITELKLPEKLEYIGLRMFYGCNFTEVNIPLSVKRIDQYAFARCLELKKVYIPSSVTVIGDRAFNQCKALTTASLVSGLKEIGESAFGECENLNVSLPHGLEIIGSGAFSGCKSITSVYIPSSVKTVGNGAFSSCEKLASIAISDSVEVIYSDSFMNTAYYADQSNWENGILYINNHLIRADKNITSAVIKDDILSIAAGAFDNCSQLTTVTMPDSLKTIGDDAFSSLYRLKTVTMGAGVEIIGAWAFSNCTALTDVNLPIGLRVIDDHAFYQCYNLAIDVNCPNLESLGERAFEYCEKLKSVRIGGTLKSIGDYCFYVCRALTDVVIYDGIETIGNYAFQQGDSLKNLTLPQSLKSIGEGAFYNCSVMEGIDFGNSLERIGKNAFFNCSSFSRIILPDSLTEMGTSAFRYCTNASEIKLSKNLKQIPGGAFDYCQAVKEVEVPYGVTEIGYDAFSGCKAMEKITIPASVDTIYYAFRGCSALKDVYYFGTNNQKAEMIIDSSNTYLKSATWNCITFTPEENATFNLWTTDLVEFSVSLPVPVEQGQGSILLRDYETDQVIAEFTENDCWVDADDETKLIFMCEDPVPCGVKIYLDFGPEAIVLKDSGEYYDVTPDKDAWSFTTSFGLTKGKERVKFLNQQSDFFSDYSQATSTYPIKSEQLKTKLEGIIGKSELKTQMKKKKAFGGACFGISTVTALYKMGLIDINQFDPDAENLYDMDKPKDSTQANGVRDLINYYYMLQRTDRYKVTGLDTVKANLMRSTSNAKSEFKTVVSGIVSKAMKTDTTKTPLILNYGWMEGGTGKQHSVVLYSARKNEDKTYSLLVKDPNYIKPVEMQVSADYSKVTDLNDNNIVLLEVIDPTTIPSDWMIGEKSRMAQVEGVTTQDYDIIRVTAYGGFEISNSNGHITVSGGNVYSSLPVISEDFRASDDGDYTELVFYVESQDEYVFTPWDTRSDCTITRGGQHFSVNAENATEVRFSIEGGIQVVGEDMTYQLFSTTSDNENMLMLAGDGANSVSVELTQEGGAEITADNLHSVQLESLYDDSVIEVDGNEKTITLYKTNSGLSTGKNSFGWTTENVVITDTSFSCDVIFDGYEEQLAYAIVAFYDDGQRLVQLAITPLTVKNGTVPLNAEIEDIPYSTYKVLIWKNPDTMEPLDK